MLALERLPGSWSIPYPTSLAACWRGLGAPIARLYALAAGTVVRVTNDGRTAVPELASPNRRPGRDADQQTTRRSCESVTPAETVTVTMAGSQ
jgi:hypothetical protein